jgi:hypothetical protein
VGSYRSDPAPGAIVLFAGGERLVVRGGAGDDAFAGELPAPTPIVMTVPAPDVALHLPTSGAYAVAWTAGGSDEVDVVLAVSRSDGAGAQVRCTTGDTGALTVPASIIERLPAPPRSTRVEVDRTEQRIMPVARAGLGVLVHSAQTAWKNGQD